MDRDRPFCHPFGKIVSLVFDATKHPLFKQKPSDFSLWCWRKRKKRLEVWEKAYNNVYSTVGKISLGEQLDLMPYLDLMISMDSANGHMAANYGTKVLTLWGMTHPFCGFAPFNQPLDHSLTLDRSLYPLIPTSVYGNRIPEGYQDAFRSMDPKRVIEKTLELLKH